jgi:protein-S-isoprenylcysteine O-methyltransferase Ste14
VTELGIRILFAVLVVAISAVQYYYRKKRLVGVEVRCQVSDKANYMIGVWALAIVLYPCGFSWYDVRVPIPEWIRLVGLIGMAISIPLSAWTYRALGGQFSSKLEVFVTHRIVQNGPYRYVRHPMYTALILCMVSTSLASTNVIVATISALAIIALLSRLKKEERMLLTCFQQTYYKYTTTTGALLPKLRLP